VWHHFPFAPQGKPVPFLRDWSSSNKLVTLTCRSLTLTLLSRVPRISYVSRRVLLSFFSADNSPFCLSPSGRSRDCWQNNIADFSPPFRFFFQVPASHVLSSTFVVPPNSTPKPLLRSTFFWVHLVLSFLSLISVGVRQVSRFLPRDRLLTSMSLHPFCLSEQGATPCDANPLTVSRL